MLQVQFDALSPPAAAAEAKCRSMVGSSIPTTVFPNMISACPTRWRDQSLDFFFFQAEDGIRDLTVTGVQTCALPILQQRQRDQLRVYFGQLAAQGFQLALVPAGQRPTGVRRRVRGEVLGGQRAGEKIGRASCRERV